MIFGKNGEYRLRLCRDSDFSQIASSIPPVKEQLSKAGRLHHLMYDDSDGFGNWVNGYYEWNTANDMFNKSLQGNDRHKERLLVITDSDESEIIYWVFLSFTKRYENSEFYKAKCNAFGICDKFRGNPVHRTGKRIWDIMSIDATIALKQPDFPLPINEYWQRNNLDENGDTTWRIKPTSAIGKKNFSQIKLNEEIERIGLENFKNDKKKFLRDDNSALAIAAQEEGAHNTGFLNHFPFIWDTYDSAEAEYL